LEARIGVRLVNRTTRRVAPTEAGARLLDRLGPALGEVEAALDAVNAFRDRPAGTLRLNVPVSAARLVLPRIGLLNLVRQSGKGAADRAIVMGGSFTAEIREE
jgi:DNA-binding transcriptional LysR family regulator